MEKYINRSTIDKTNIAHFVFILSIYFILSFVMFDLGKEDERSFVFAILVIIWIAYGAGSDKISTFEFRKTTDYTSSNMFAGICMCWWVALTDYFLVLDHSSRFTGLFLTFSLLLTIGLIADIMLYFSDRAGKSITPCFIIRPGQMLLLLNLGGVLYFLIFGTWGFHIGSPFEFLSNVMRGY